MNGKKDFTLIAVRCPIDLEHKARVLAAQMRMSKSELVRQALIEKIARLEPKEKHDAILS